jgi:DNA-binding MarR family transcriptional regulator
MKASTARAARVSNSNNSNVSKIEDLGWATKLVRAIEEFRKINPDVSANQVLAFMYIGTKPGISQRELGGLLGVPEGTISRICAVLSDRGNRGTPGQGLIEISQSREDYRVSAQHLSTKGRRVFESLRHILGA